MITLYTIGCPACIILEKKLLQANINYTSVSDQQILQEKGIIQFPVLEVNGVRYSFGEANKWLKEYLNGH